MKKEPTEVRFWRHVRCAEDPNICWDWTGYLQRGYGRIKDNSKQRRAHRWAYEAFVGPISRGLTIDHLCRNRACVNPAHLEVVSAGENVLRGYAPAAINARKTHCKYGHRFTVETAKPVKRHGRIVGVCCRICERRERRRRRQGPPPPTIRHGTISGYTNYRCRCAKCCEVRSASDKEYKSRKREMFMARLREWL